MKLGIGLGQDASPKLARMVEDLGFDSVWSGDRFAVLNRARPVTDGLIAAAAMVGATSRIRVGTSVYLLPLRPAVTVAKAVTVLAHIAEGRFAFGVGIGGTEDHQYEIAGVPINERGARCNESISFLREAARGEQFDFEGRFTRVEGARFLPTAPFAILVGGSSLAAQRRAARLGDGYMPFHVSLDRIREARDEVERQGAAARPGFEYVAHVYIAMNASRERALDHARENMARRYGEQVRETVERFAVVGTPETCRTYLADLAALGVTEALLAPVGTPETMPGEIQSLARELLK